MVLQFKPVRQIVNALVIETNLINKDSLTIKTRVTPPKGFLEFLIQKGLSKIIYEITS